MTIYSWDYFLAFSFSYLRKIKLFIPLPFITMDKWNIGALKLLNNGLLTQIVLDLENPLSKKRKAFTAIIICR